MAKTMNPNPNEELWGSFWDHVEELRKSLIKIFLVVGGAFILLLCFYQPIFTLLNKTAVYSLNAEVAPLMILGPLDGIQTVFRLCFWLSLAVTAPLWGWISFRFIAPGLRADEKRVAVSFLFWSGLWISIGGAIALLFTIPLTNTYLSSFNAAIGQNMWSLERYIDYTLILFLGHVVAFELGSLLLLLVHWGLLSSAGLIRQRKIMIVVAFVLGGILTPPDIVSQLMLALPLIGLYECAILYAKRREKRPKLLDAHMD